MCYIFRVQCSTVTRAGKSAYTRHFSLSLTLLYLLFHSMESLSFFFSTFFFKYSPMQWPKKKSFRISNALISRWQLNKLWALQPLGSRNTLLAFCGIMCVFGKVQKDWEWEREREKKAHKVRKKNQTKPNQTNANETKQTNHDAGYSSLAPFSTDTYSSYSPSSSWYAVKPKPESFYSAHVESYWNINYIKE